MGCGSALAATCCYKSVTSCCGCLPTNRKGSLIPYIVLLFLAVVLALIFRFNFSGFLSHLFYESLHECSTCIGYGAVFRISFATFFFFFTHAILLCAPICWQIDTFSWLGKVLYWFALLALAFLLPEDFYRDFYVHVARVVGGFFLLLQVVILVDFAHSLNEKWLAVPDESQTKYKALIVIVGLILLLGSGVVMVLCYLWWGSCALQKFFISWTLIGTFIMLLLCVSEKFSEKGGLLPGAIVCIYCWWLCYSALNSDPSTCNTRSQEGTAQLVIGLIVAACSVAYAGWSVGTHAGLFGVEEEAAARSQEEKAESEAAQGIADGDREAAHQRAIDMEAQDASSEFALVARRNFRFHLVMSACAMYFSMLLTNWGSMSAAEDVDLNGGDLTGRAYDLSAESMYVKIISQWLTMILFTWSVVAPVLCKGRDFG